MTVLYGLSPAMTRDCQELTSELRTGCVEVKHLQAACAALEAYPQAFLVASLAIKSWDRHVLDEHAARSGATLHWVDPQHLSGDVAAVMRAWAAAAVRRARTGR